MATAAARGRRGGAGGRSKNPRVLATALIAPAVLYIALLVGRPLLLAGYLAFTNATAGSLRGDWVGLENFSNQWHDPVFRDALRNTFFFTIVSQVIVVVCAAFLARFLIKDFRGKWFFRFLILLPWAAPVALSTLGRLWIFDSQFSVVNWVLWKARLHRLHHRPPVDRADEAGDGRDHHGPPWRLLPFATVIMIAGLASIPKGRRLRGRSTACQPAEAVVRDAAAAAPDRDDRRALRDRLHRHRHGRREDPHERRAFNSTQMLTTWAYATGVESRSLGPGAAVALFLLPILAAVSILMLVFARRVEVS